MSNIRLKTILSAVLNRTCFLLMVLLLVGACGDESAGHDARKSAIKMQLLADRLVELHLKAGAFPSNIKNLSRAMMPFGRDRAATLLTDEQGREIGYEASENSARMYFSSDSSDELECFLVADPGREFLFKCVDGEVGGFPAYERAYAIDGLWSKASVSAKTRLDSRIDQLRTTRP